MTWSQAAHAHEQWVSGPPPGSCSLPRRPITLSGRHGGRRSVQHRGHPYVGGRFPTSRGPIHRRNGPCRLLWRAPSLT